MTLLFHGKQTFFKLYRTCHITQRSHLLMKCDLQIMICTISYYFNVPASAASIIA